MEKILKWLALILPFVAPILYLATPAGTIADYTNLFVFLVLGIIFFITGIILVILFTKKKKDKWLLILGIVYGVMGIIDLVLYIG